MIYLCGAGCWQEALVPPHVGGSIGCLSILITWCWLLPDRVIKIAEQKPLCLLWSCLGNHTPSFLQYPCCNTSADLATQVSPIHFEGDYTRILTNTRRQKSLRVLLEVPYSAERFSLQYILKVTQIWLSQLEPDKFCENRDLACMFSTTFLVLWTVSGTW